jgi:hypothetical protein
VGVGFGFELFGIPFMGIKDAWLFFYSFLQQMAAVKGCLHAEKRESAWGPLLHGSA